VSVVATSRWTTAGALAALLVGLALPTVAADGVSGVRVAADLLAEVVVTGIGRPIQLALDGTGRLVVLSHGRRGDAAAELSWVDLDAALPVDGSRVPHVVIPFADGPRKTAFGSLAVDRGTGDVYLGEENGNRIYRLGGDRRFAAVAVGLHHLVGGSALALDGHGHLVVVDFASPETYLRSEAAPPSGLDSLTQDYNGPLVFRVSLGPTVSLPRRLDLVPPLFPRTWARAKGEPLTRFIAVMPRPDGDLVLLDSLGQVLVLGARGLIPLARLPAGHYHRTSIALGADGALLVSTGFQVRQVFRVDREGAVTVVASDLGDPGGVVVDAAGRLYVAETALHRVIRIRARH
jgi:hypothetical protein